MFQLISGIIGAAQNHWTSGNAPKVEYKPKYDAMAAAMQRRSDALGGGSEILSTLLKGKDSAAQAGDKDAERAMDQAIQAHRSQPRQGEEEVDPATGRSKWRSGV